jgi:hypothetical protein
MHSALHFCWVLCCEFRFAACSIQHCKRKAIQESSQGTCRRPRFELRECRGLNQRSPSASSNLAPVLRHIERSKAPTLFSRYAEGKAMQCRTGDCTEPWDGLQLSHVRMRPGSNPGLPRATSRLFARAPGRVAYWVSGSLVVACVLFHVQRGRSS